LKTLTDAPNSPDFAQALEVARQVADRQKLSVLQWEVSQGDTMACLPFVESALGGELKARGCALAKVKWGEPGEKAGQETKVGYLIAVVGSDRRVAALWSFDTSFRAAVLYVPPTEMLDFRHGAYRMAANGEVLQVAPNRVSIPAKGSAAPTAQAACGIYGTLMPGEWPEPLAAAVTQAGYQSGEEVRACLDVGPRK
jgi:hypothetical protein